MIFLSKLGRNNDKIGGVQPEKTYRELEYANSCGGGRNLLQWPCLTFSTLAVMTLEGMYHPVC